MRASASGREPVAVAALIALDAALFAVPLAHPAAAGAVAGLALVPYDLAHGVTIEGGPPALATLATSLAVHANAGHLASNMLVLALAGPAVERAIGPLAFVSLYLACGVAGGLAQTLAAPGSHVPIVGASGAVAGILGAFVLRYPTARRYGVPAAIPIGLWVAVQYALAFGASGAGGAGIAYAAHVGGFVTGALATALETRA